MLLAALFCPSIDTTSVAAQELAGFCSLIEYPSESSKTLDFHMNWIYDRIYNSYLIRGFEKRIRFCFPMGWSRLSCIQKTCEGSSRD